MTIRDSADELVCDHCDKFPTTILFNVWQALHWLNTPSLSSIHVHRLNFVRAGRSRRLTVGTATSAILANICCTTRGHSEWVLIPTQPCCGGKHSFLLVSADKQGQAVLLVTCRQTGLLEGPEMLSVTWPPIVPRPIMAVQRGVTASVGSELPSLVQLDGFRAWG